MKFGTPRSTHHAFWSQPAPVGYCQGDPIRLGSSCWDDPSRPECQFGNPTSILWAFDHNQVLSMDIYYIDANTGFCFISLFSFYLERRRYSESRN